MGKKRHPDEDQGFEEGVYGLMHAAGFTSVQQLSDHSGVSARTIYNCHYRLRKPSRGTVYLLANSLKISKDRLRQVIGDPA